MVSVNIHEAKTNLSRLIERVERGEQIVLARAGKPVATISKFKPPTVKRKGGQWRGKVWMSKDFDAPLPEEILKYFEGRGED